MLEIAFYDKTYGAPEGF